MTVAGADFNANRQWIKEKIQWEFYFRAFGKNAAERARWAADPGILKAIESMPKVQGLLSSSQKCTPCARNNAGASALTARFRVILGNRSVTVAAPIRA